MILEGWFANIPPISMIERIEVVRGPMIHFMVRMLLTVFINIITKKKNLKRVDRFNFP